MSSRRFIITPHLLKPHIGDLISFGMSTASDKDTGMSKRLFPHDCFSFHSRDAGWSQVRSHRYFVSRGFEGYQVGESLGGSIVVHGATGPWGPTVVSIVDELDTNP